MNGLKNCYPLRKQSLFILLITVSLLFTACTFKSDIFENPEIPTLSSSPALESDPPHISSGPTQPAKPDPNALTVDEIAELQNIYQLVKTDTGHLLTNFYNAALGMEYTDPRHMSISFLFRNGDGEEFETTRMTEEEYEFLKSAEPNAEHLDWYRISQEDVERILQMCFGLTLSDMNTDLGSLHYWDKTNCYYSGTTSPAPYVDNLVITGGTHLADGNLMVFYTSQEGTWGALEQYVMMLKPVNGGYHILSNQKSST